jgi:hypothetical protein
LIKRTYLTTIFLNNINHNFAQTFSLDGLLFLAHLSQRKKINLSSRIKKRSTKCHKTIQLVKKWIQGWNLIGTNNFYVNHFIQVQQSTPKDFSSLQTPSSQANKKYFSQKLHFLYRRQKKSKSITKNIQQYQVNKKGQVYVLTKRIYLKSIILKKCYLYLAKTFHCEKAVGLNTIIAFKKYAFVITQKITVQKINI